ncbi:MAG: hypothetical protein QNL62_01835 [Gammaproteobacteria bacterium]|nr:hypothetical protein [Gammaproteobacteria bacterium]
MDSKFNVVYTGKLQDGVHADEFVTKFCSKFGIGESKARQISASTSDVIIKKDLDEDKAKKYLAALEGCGMIARLDEIAAEPEFNSSLSLEPIEGDEPAESDSVSTEPENNNKAVCPKCGSDQIEGDECKACGIYISKYLSNQQENSVQAEPENNNEGYTEQVTEMSNPYATPGADLERNFISKDGQGSLEGGINGDYDFAIGEIFSEAWERTSGAKGTFILAWVFYILLAIAVNAVLTLIAPNTEMLFQQGRITEGVIWGLLPSLVTIPILYPILAGITLLGIHRSVDADISASSVFSHYGKIIPFTILGILMSIMIILGYVLLIIPGIYLSIAYLMAIALMVDKDMGVWEAMEASRKAVTKHWFKIFFLYFLLGLLLMVATIPFLIGLIWVLPLAAILHGVLYKYMFGVDSVE